jgi:hypothetical protein
MHAAHAAQAVHAGTAGTQVGEDVGCCIAFCFVYSIVKGCVLHDYKHTAADGT